MPNPLSFLVHHLASQNILEFSGLCSSGTSLEPPRGQSGRVRGVHFTDGARQGSRFPAVSLLGPPGSSEWPTRECVMIPGAAGQVFWRWGRIMHPSYKHVWSLLPPRPALGGWMHHLGPSPPASPPNTAGVAITKPAFWRGRLRPEGWGGVACLKSHIWGAAVQGFGSGPSESKAPPPPAAACWPVSPWVQG